MRASSRTHDVEPPPTRRGAVAGHGRSVGRVMATRWVIALLALGAVILGGLVLFEQQTRTLDSMAGVLNIKGRQRMLSQRAGLVASQLLADDGSRSAGLRRELGRIAEQMETAHLGLLEGNPAIGLQRPPAAVREILMGTPDSLDRGVLEFVSLLRSAAGPEVSTDAVEPGLTRIVDVALRGTLLERLDAAVSEYQSAMEESVARLRRAQLAMAGLALLLLAAIGELVIRPLARDVSRQIRRLRASQERFRQVVETVREVFWLYDPAKGRMEYVSPAFSRVWGIPAARLLENSKLWDLAVLAEDRAQVEERLYQGLAGRRFDLEYRIRRADGSVRWIQDRGFPVLDERGGVARIGGVAEDVTERKGAQEGLRQRAEELRLILENAPVGIATWDLEGRLVNVNQALCSMLGHQEEELLGLPYREITHEEDARAIALFVGFETEGAIRPAALEVRYRHRDGHLLPGLLRCGVVRDASGEPLQVIAEFQDRSAEVQAEQEASRARERLAHVTRLGTMGEMAAGIAHEINQPLSAIGTYAQACRRLIIAGGADDARLLETLDKVSTQAHRAGEVIRRLRSFVRRRESRFEVHDANGIVREAVKLAETEARVRDADIVQDLAAGLSPVHADPVQIQQVILNLIRNGLEAMQEAGAVGESLVVRTRAHDREGVEISVTDHGAGLAPAAEETLFRPFHTTKPDGLGMGLSISRSIVRSHGGTIWHTPEPAGGSTFRFTIPVASTEG